MRTRTSGTGERNAPSWGKSRNRNPGGSVTLIMRANLGAVAILCVSTILSGASSELSSARQKLQTIEEEKLSPGSTVLLSKEELNAYVRQELAPEFPDGVRDLNLQLGKNTAIGSALIDFGRVRRAQGKAPGWLVEHLLDGERPVTVRARIVSSAGRATVNVESVEISDISIDGPVLDYLVRNYLVPNYPQAKVNTPFTLGHRIDRLDVQPEAVRVVIGR